MPVLFMLCCGLYIEGRKARDEEKVCADGKMDLNILWSICNVVGGWSLSWKHSREVARTREQIWNG